MNKIYNQYMYSYPNKRNYDFLDSKVIKDSIMKIENGELSLYFHIPFFFK